MQITASWTNPILIDGANGIVAGPGRVLAARKLGIDPVPCIEFGRRSDGRKSSPQQHAHAERRVGGGAAVGRAGRPTCDMALDLSLVGFGEAEQAAVLAKRVD